MTQIDVDDPLSTELLEFATDTLMAGVCIVTIKNGVSCRDKVTIIGAACEFYYRSGGKYTDKDEKLSLDCGESSSLRSDDANECVGRVKVAILVTHPKAGKRVFLGARSVPEDKCLLRTTFTLGEKETKSVDEQVDTWLDTIEIESTD